MLIWNLLLVLSASMMTLLGGLGFLMIFTGIIWDGQSQPVTHLFGAIIWLFGSYFTIRFLKWVQAELQLQLRWKLLYSILTFAGFLKFFSYRLFLDFQMLAAPNYTPDALIILCHLAFFVSYVWIRRLFRIDKLRK